MCSNDCIIDMFGQRIIRWVAHCSQYMTNDLYFQAVWRNVLATVDCWQLWTAKEHNGLIDSRELAGTRCCSRAQVARTHSRRQLDVFIHII